ncbi:multidrug transporter [Flavobacterium sufflavum]|uniref:Multidrug transporter n=2 Tax=Flavobacterium sufflavum TaxID=1921138 RepID=A0A437KTL1_9FLAO|nr:multidrug transporter [Flavobacterium sufflavum]
MTAQQKQYKSAETGRYVSKSTATKSPSTTYSTTRSKK